MTCYFMSCMRLGLDMWCLSAAMAQECLRSRTMFVTSMPIPCPVYQPRNLGDGAFIVAADNAKA